MGSRLTILPADPSERKIGFIVREYIGSEVYKKLDSRGSPIPLTKREDLQEGDVVFAWGGEMQFTIVRGENGSLRGGTKRTMIFLEFAKDDRKCWVAGGVANLKALGMLKINT